MGIDKVERGDTSNRSNIADDVRNEKGNRHHLSKEKCPTTRVLSYRVHV